ncbi:MAG: hypothetical protein LBF61_02720 [Azoarcus sp.]|jgi:hypothetical protein|nr:hypothetical protein [Azoarcus sp.]
MSTIKVLAGDLDKGSWQFSGMFGVCIMTRASTTKSLWKGETYDFKTDVESIDQLTEEKAKKLAGTAAWGAAGAILFGPLGAIGGLLLGGNKTEIAFICHLKDGQKFMAITDSKTWLKIMAARF